MSRKLATIVAAVAMFADRRPGGIGSTAIAIPGGLLGPRRSVLPARWQRRLRCPALRPRAHLRPGHGPVDGHRDHHRPGDPEPVRVQLRLHRHAVAVADRQRGSAKTSRKGQELTVKPATGLTNGSTFTVVARYDGVPEPIVEEGLGELGFLPTEDGAIVQGEPHVAATWFPANDHPRDKASFTFHITIPTGLEAIANGVLVSQQPNGASTTWNWNAVEPMVAVPGDDGHRRISRFATTSSGRDRLLGRHRRRPCWSTKRHRSRRSPARNSCGRRSASRRTSG